MSICSPKITGAVCSFKFKTVLPRYNTGAFIVKAAAAFPGQLLVFLRIHAAAASSWFNLLVL